MEPYRLVRYVREQGGDGAMAEVLDRARVQQHTAALQATSMWVEYDTRIRLFEAATAVLGEATTMFAVGASAVSENIPPVLVQLLSPFASPGAVYRQMPRIVPKFTTTSTIDATARPSRLDS